MRRLKADWLMFRSSAEREKLPLEARLMKSSSQPISMWFSPFTGRRDNQRALMRIVHNVSKMSNGRIRVPAAISIPQDSCPVVLTGVQVR